jgi:hypothetical protein
MRKGRKGTLCCFFFFLLITMKGTLLLSNCRDSLVGTPNPKHCPRTRMIIDDGG